MQTDISFKHSSKKNNPMDYGKENSGCFLISSNDSSSLPSTNNSLTSNGGENHGPNDYESGTLCSYKIGNIPFIENVDDEDLDVPIQT